MQCPCCKADGTLSYEQDALIMFPVKDGKLKKAYDITCVSLLDNGVLICLNCGEDSDENDELGALLNFLLDVEREEDIKKNAGS